MTHLHRHNAVINDDFLCEKVSADRGLVLIGEAFIHVLVHQRRLSHAGVAQNDDLQQNLLSRRHFNHCEVDNSGLVSVVTSIS